MLITFIQARNTIFYIEFEVKGQQYNIVNLANSTNVNNILRDSPTTIQTVLHSGRYSLLYEHKLIEK